MLSNRAEALWSSVQGQSLLGIGYPAPVVGGLCRGARRSAAIMPFAQGAAPWDLADRGNVAILSDDARLPFADQMFDRVVLAHALEEADSPRAMLREIWRVTAPEGRLLVVAANRRGLWARAEATPFGHGRPWTRAQLSTLLENSLFQTTAWTHALHTPPIPWSLNIALSSVWESFGESTRNAFGGVVMVEAVKRLYIDPRGGAVELSLSGAHAARTRKGLANAPKQQAPERPICEDAGRRLTDDD